MLTCETICLDVSKGDTGGIGGSAYWCIDPPKFLAEIAKLGKNNSGQLNSPSNAQDNNKNN